MKEWFWIILVAIIWVLGAINIQLQAVKYDDLENQAIEKGYAEIQVINGERKFQWK